VHPPLVKADVGRILHPRLLLGRVVQRSFVFKAPEALHIFRVLGIALCDQGKSAPDVVEIRLSLTRWNASLGWTASRVGSRHELSAVTVALLVTEPAR
jgi:hypothetical protein